MAASLGLDHGYLSRILRSFEGEAEGVAEDKILEEILKKLPESKG